MTIDRRRFLALSLVGAGAASAIPREAAAAPLVYGIDVTQLGVRPDAAEDQSGALQRAIERAAAERTPLFFPAGIYRATGLRLPSHAKLAGIRGASRIVSTRGAPLLSSRRADNLELSGLVFEGARTRSGKEALVHLAEGENIRIADCDIVNAPANALTLEQVGGSVSTCSIHDAGDTAIHSLDARGLLISGNIIRRSGNAGIQVWRSSPGDDGTQVLDNRIEDTRADSGGNGPYGNAINIFRAGNVIVRGNRIHKAAFSAVRGNGASNIQIAGNMCTQLGEVAIYAEFAFEGAVITGNTVDSATTGISVTNFNEGGRLAVVQGNLLRNLGPEEEGKGIGIAVEADSAVTGNVIENASSIGIAVGYGPYLRDVLVSANILRATGIGIGISVVDGAGGALITDNLIAEARYGAIVGLEWQKRVTGDMAKDGPGRYTRLSIRGNRLR